MPLALYTFGQFLRPADDPANDGFYALNDPVFATVDAAPGLIARSGYAADAGPESWGAEVYPRFHDDTGDGWSPATLSLWTDPEAIFAFTYSGLHASALKRGREWFVKPTWPPLVMWWMATDARPTWADGVRRLERLHDTGPSPDAFSFKALYNATGQPGRLDAARVRDLRAAKASR